MIVALTFAILIAFEGTLCDPLVEFERGITEYFRTGTRPDYFESALEKTLRTSGATERDSRICALCRIVSNVAIESRRRGAKRQVIIDVSTDLCTLLAGIGYTSCVGYIDITIDVFLYIIDNKADLTPERICAIRLQENGCTDSNYVPWSIDLPPGQSHPLSKTDVGPNRNILHLTDIHYDPLYEPKSNANCGNILCCEHVFGAPSSASDEAGYWGDYASCDMPWHSVEDLLLQVKKQHKQLDWVYFTGDIISHQVWNTSRDSNQLYITKVLEKLQNTFGTTPVYPILGNHEAHPTDFYPPQTVSDNFSIRWLFNYIAEEWSRWLPTSTLATVRQGGFYTVLVKPGFRIIALNSNVCFTYNIWLVYDDVDPYNQLQWLSDTLLEAEKNREAVHILSHVPPGDFECNQQWSHEFRRIVERFRHTITAQFNGHTHYDEMKVFINSSNQNDVINVAFNGGSVTTFVGLNPNYRIYTVEAHHGLVLDYDQWTYNLSEANQNPDTRPKWYKLYSFKDTYKFVPSDLPKYVELVQNFSTKSNLLENYRRFQVRNSAAALSQKCDEVCFRNIICSIISVEYTDLVRCQRQTHKDRVNDEL